MVLFVVPIFYDMSEEGTLPSLKINSGIIGKQERIYIQGDIHII